MIQAAVRSTIRTIGVPDSRMNKADPIEEYVANDMSATDKAWLSNLHIDDYKIGLGEPKSDRRQTTTRRCTAASSSLAHVRTGSCRTGFR
jgi:hypothetical protein